MRYAFICRLHPGAYCINAGVSAADDREGRFHAHRILDALIFRVADEEKDISNGIVDFSPKPEIVLLESEKNRL